VPSVRAEESSWKSYWEVGTKATEKGQFVEAQKSLSLAVKEAEKYGPADARLVTSLNKLAALYEEHGRYAESEPLYTRALNIDEKALGSSHLDVAADLCNLAEVLFEEHKYAQSEALFKRGLAIQEKTLGPSHPTVATTLRHLAGVYMLQGKNKQANPLYERASAIQQKTCAFKSNGTMWLEFGPAVVDCCRCIELFQGYEPLVKDGKPKRQNIQDWVESDLSKPKKVTVNDRDPQFVAIKKWIQRNVEGLLNCSPKAPCDESVEVSNYLMLYSSDTGGWVMGHVPQDARGEVMEEVITRKMARGDKVLEQKYLEAAKQGKNSGSQKALMHVLLILPLTDDTLGPNYESKLAELKALMQTKK
jgi:tetratricopeptide (TPR) repeat protein